MQTSTGSLFFPLRPAWKPWNQRGPSLDTFSTRQPGSKQPLSIDFEHPASRPVCVQLSLPRVKSRKSRGSAHATGDSATMNMTSDIFFPFHPRLDLIWVDKVKYSSGLF